MKMLVCVDGSEHSIKAIGEAVKIAKGWNINEVAIIYVCERSLPAIPEGGTLSKEDIEKIQSYIYQCESEESQKVLSEAKDNFANNNIEAKTIFKEGHPAQTIINVANEEGYDLVVIGSRGLSGFKKLLLGSVSSAVTQEVKSNVYVVK